MKIYFIAICCLLFSVAPSFSQIYKWVEKNGTITFSDKLQEKEELIENKLGELENTVGTNNMSAIESSPDLTLITKLASNSPKSSTQPTIMVLWEGPVGEAAAQTLVSRITELGHPAKTAALPWEGNADLKLYIKTQLKERLSSFINPKTGEKGNDIVTDTMINVSAEDRNGTVLLQQRLNHPFSVRIDEGLDEAARNLMRSGLLKFDQKFELALKGLKQDSTAGTSPPNN